MIRTETHDGVVTLHMEHGQANALDVELCQKVAETMRDLANKPDARAVILTGTGGVFSAGVDLKRIISGGADYVGAFLPALRAVLEACFLFPKPLVAAINGHAIAGGCIMACAADVRLMARGPGLIGIPELKVGVPFPVVGIETMRFALPSTTFRRLVLFGETLRVEDARSSGLIDGIAAPDALLDRARESVNTLLSVPDETFRLTKVQIRLPATERMVRGRTQDDPRIDAIWAKPETIGKVQEYVTKTLTKKA